jgi:tRNA-2-methylthio-N6-dimethylallyladenosine synthase
LQSGSDRVLAAMKRGYTALEYKSIVRRLRAARPDISISSDFIVGFPGETEADFEATMKLVEEIGFDDSYSFLYSPRPGTPAAELGDDTPQGVKAERLARLQAAIDGQARAINHAMVGTTQRVLVEGAAKRNASELCGRSDSNRMVNFAGPQQLVGQLIDVTITAALTHSLRGECRVTPSVGECLVPPPVGECRVTPPVGECRVPAPLDDIRIAAADGAARATQ